MLINDAKPVWAILSFRLSRFSPCSVRMRSVAASGMIRYCLCIVVRCISVQKFLVVFFGPALFFLLFFLNLLCQSCSLCFDHQYVDCVILDDGGFLLMSNQDEYIGQVRVQVPTSASYYFVGKIELHFIIKNKIKYK